MKSSFKVCVEITLLLFHNFIFSLFAFNLILIYLSVLYYFRLKRKQPFYPVVFISSCENSDYPSCMDLRCRTFKMALNFAKSEELLVRVILSPLFKSIAPFTLQVKPASTKPGFRIGPSDWSVQQIQSFDWLKFKLV